MWEKIPFESTLKITGIGAYSERLEVPGGWLVRTLSNGYGVATTFVPDKSHSWKFKK